MPKAGSYGSMQVGETVADALKRRPASQRSYLNAGMGMSRQVAVRTTPGGGKFGGLPGGPSGGGMNAGGKRRPGKRTVGG